MGILVLLAERTDLKCIDLMDVWVLLAESTDLTA